MTFHPCITIKTFLLQAKDKLSSTTDVPMLEAEILLAHLLNQSRSFLHAWPERLLTEAEYNQASAFIDRRLKHEPIAYITGNCEFWSLDLAVNADTLIPRPETELLVESALAIMKEEKEEVCIGESIKIADLGTGSGAIGLSLAHSCKAAQIFAVDISDNALEVASSNAIRLGIANISFHQSHWFRALPHTLFDMIVSNPPYLSEAEWRALYPKLKYEPSFALVSGIDGLDAMREIAQEAKYYLKSGGYLLVEHGFSQGSLVRGIFEALCYANIYTLKDLSGQERVTIARYL